MKRLLLFLFMACPFSLFAQEKREAPFKGATKIISTYNLGADSLFRYISKALISAGYGLKMRDKELLYIATDQKPVEQINYTLKLVVKDSTIETTGMYISAIGFQIGYAKTEPAFQELKYVSKIYVTRKAFDQVIDFVESTNPVKIEYSK